MNTWLAARLSRWEERGYLNLIFLLLAEATTIGFVVFAGLFSLEMLLPTFITARLSLTTFLLILLILLIFLLMLGKKIGVNFSPVRWYPRWWFVLLIIWSSALTLIGLFKFPWWAILVLALLIGGSGYLCIRLYLDTEPQRIRSSD